MFTRTAISRNGTRVIIADRVLERIHFQVTIDVLIIGCGAIAGGYDETGDRTAVRTHAAAYTCHPNVRLIACVEPDDKRRAAFMRRWSVSHSFATMQEFLDSGLKADVVSICSPTWAHLEGLEAALLMGAKAVLCEKPLTDNVQASQRVVADFTRQGVLLGVNYLRRYDETVVEARQQLRAGVWGKVQTAVGIYGKGILHNGSHMVDLIHYLIGEPLRPMGVLTVRRDRSATDPTVDAWLRAPGDIPIHLVGTDGGLFDVFELTIITDGGVLAFEEGGLTMRLRPAQTNPMFPTHRSVSSGERRTTNLATAMASSIDSLLSSLTKSGTLSSHGQSALAAQSVCEQLLHMIDTQPTE
jgi:predicted dehydrogenase